MNLDVSHLFKEHPQGYRVSSPIFCYNESAGRIAHSHSLFSFLQICLAMYFIGPRNKSIIWPWTGLYLNILKML